MNFSFLILIFSFIVFLFSLYILSKDDYILLRKNVPTDKVFDLAFIVGLIGLFSARLFYVVFHFNPAYFNPLVFFIFPYFPGLSLAGFAFGVLIFILSISKVSKLPLYHLLDFAVLSFLITLPFTFLIQDLINFGSKKINLWHLISEILLYSLLASGSIIYFKKFKLNEGSFAFLFLIFFAITSFLINVFNFWKNFAFLSDKDNLLLILIFGVSFFLLEKQEHIIRRLIKKDKSK